jgi:hypothetical protein
LQLALEITDEFVENSFCAKHFCRHPDLRRRYAHQYGKRQEKKLMIPSKDVPMSPRPKFIIQTMPTEAHKELIDRVGLIKTFQPRVANKMRAAFSGALRLRKFAILNNYNILHS